MESKPILIVVGSRASKLAIKQVEEVFNGLQYHYPHVLFSLRCCQTTGDLDQVTSLKDLGQTNFFTKELDEWVLNHSCQIAIHSAKDLPDPLPKGLNVVAITQNKNNQDVLVLKPQIKLSELPKQAKIGSSSLRREEGISKWIPKAHFYDLRGSIEHRIKKVTEGELDGVVMAKVALMRLNLMHLNFIDLPVTPPPLQGSLAIVAREGDIQMEEIFASIDVRRRRKSLFLGLNCERFLTSGSLVHYPMIRISPKPITEILRAIFYFQGCSHLLLTSTSTVKLFFEILEKLDKPLTFLNQKKIIAVGRATSEFLMKNGLLVDYVALKESQEGIMELFERLKLPKSHLIFYPKSSLARPNLIEYFKKKGIHHQAPDLYDTELIALDPRPKIEDFDEIVFTSPTVVKSFFKTFTLPEKKIKYLFKGKVTEDYFISRSLNPKTCS